MNPESHPRYCDYWTISPDHGASGNRISRAILRTNTAIGGIMVHRGEADSLICGTFGEYRWHLNYVQQLWAALPHGALSIFRRWPRIADTQVRIV